MKEDWQFYGKGKKHFVFPAISLTIECYQFQGQFSNWGHYKKTFGSSRVGNTFGSSQPSKRSLISKWWWALLFYAPIKWLSGFCPIKTRENISSSKKLVLWVTADCNPQFRVKSRPKKGFKKVNRWVILRNISAWDKEGNNNDSCAALLRVSLSHLRIVCDAITHSNFAELRNPFETRLSLAEKDLMREQRGF